MLRFLLPDPELIVFDKVMIDESDGQIICVAASTQTTAICPVCEQQAIQVHSDYQRKLADLPWAGVPVQIWLQVRRFFCKNSACRRKIFCERILTVAAPWARRTRRLAEAQQAVGLIAGGSGGTRLCAALAMDAGIDLVLALIRDIQLPERPTPRVLGVDDWAMRKGKTYGTILVDLEQGEIVDVLPDRTAESLEAWLKAHPGVEIISRDRAGAYAEGVRKGAPEAIQVADRWHLLANLGDALTRVLEPYQEAIKRTLANPSPRLSSKPDTATPRDREELWFEPSSSVQISGPGDPAGHDAALRSPELSPAVPPPSTQKEVERQQRRERRLARYEKVCRLYKEGWSLSAIADQMDMDRNTVRKYVNASAFPELQPRTSQQSSILDPFKPYILERWNAGCHTGMTILHEVVERGYTGGKTTLLAYITQLRKAAGLPPKKRVGVSAETIDDPTRRPPTLRGLTWLIMSKPETLDDEQSQQLASLRQIIPVLEMAVTLAQEFTAIVRERQPERLDGWLDSVEQQNMPALISFAAGLRRDYAAVKAAMSMSFSNGPTEGHINRLKSLKREMYGRAKLDLLRQRLLAA